jgi:hypothetical protein
MKKLLFVLLMAVIGGMLFAMTPIHPPGEFNSDIVMTEFNIQESIDTQSEVLAFATPATVELSSLQAIMAINETAVKPQYSGIMINFMRLECFRNASSATDYHLRL